MYHPRSMLHPYFPLLLLLFFFFFFTVWLSPLRRFLALVATYCKRKHCGGSGCDRPDVPPCRVEGGGGGAHVQSLKSVTWCDLVRYISCARLASPQSPTYVSQPLSHMYVLISLRLTRPSQLQARITINLKRPY